ncbi:uncharacterized protein MKK02DRAFT_29496 [Dioszegia hungarica]|uniref:Uncharacterized protein n=1 Tax=Dioszegia hungarica TaxID=4972 RepID=A0AA38LX30_9TREE|nr:uncharacterized protein MKK02DRAFT_29496 [Dioszegia hungarica]KAI9639432.1 hypothetical protein MKK02DRAFT_29496 [Dioszegia hungarica]
MQPLIPRTYKERLWAHEDPSRVPERLTRGKRRVRYRQLERDIGEFETLVPTPVRAGGTVSPRSGSSRGYETDDYAHDRSASYEGRSQVQWAARSQDEQNRRERDITASVMGTPAPIRYTAPIPATPGSVQREDDGWVTPTPVPVPSTPAPRTRTATPFSRAPASEPPFTPTPAQRVPPVLSFPNNTPLKSRALPQADPFQTPLRAPAKLPARPAFALRVPPAPATPAAPSIQASVPSTPHRSMDITPRRPSMTSINPATLLTQVSEEGTPEPSPQPVSPLRPGPTFVANSSLDSLYSRLLARSIATPRRPRTPPAPAVAPIQPPTPLVDLAPAEPARPDTPATAQPSVRTQGVSSSDSIPVLEPHRPSLAEARSPTPATPNLKSASPASIPLPETPRASPPAPAPFPSLPIPSPPVPASHLSTPTSASPPHLDLGTVASPPPASSFDVNPNSAGPALTRSITPTMRGAGGFDDVLGRIRTARNSTYDDDGGTPPAPKSRYDDLPKRPDSTRPRGGEEKLGDRSSDLMEALQKENREYKREVGKMRQELDELLCARSDAKSSSGNDAALRVAERKIRDQGEALEAAEKFVVSLEQERRTAARNVAETPIRPRPTAQTPTRSRYRSDTPSPTRPRSPILAASRRADELAEKNVMLKGQIHDLKLALQNMEQKLKEEVDARRTADSQALGARSQASIATKEKNGLESKIVTLERQVEVERRQRYTALDKIKTLENSNFGTVQLRQQVATLRNSVTSAQQELTNAHDKFRDMSKKKLDLEDKVKIVRRENDSLKIDNDELKSLLIFIQLKSEEQLIKEKERLRVELIKEGSQVAERLRGERRELKSKLADSRNEIQQLKREVEIQSQAASRAAKKQRSEERKRRPVATLASEISMPSLRPSRSISPSPSIATESDTSDAYADAESDGGTETGAHTPRGASRRLTPRRSPSSAEKNEEYIEKLYKLLTPLQPDRIEGEDSETDTRAASSTAPASEPVSPMSTILSQPIIIDISDPPAITATATAPVPVPSQAQGRTTRSAPASVDVTPPALRRGAMINLETPIVRLSAPASTATATAVGNNIGIVPAPHAQVDRDTGKQSRDEDSISARTAKAKEREKRETLMHVDDVFSEGATTVESDLKPQVAETPLILRRSKCIKDDLEYLDYDPFAGISEEFGMSGGESDSEGEVTGGRSEPKSTMGVEEAEGEYGSEADFASIEID